jgi:hypothetical protein
VKRLQKIMQVKVPARFFHILAGVLILVAAALTAFFVQFRATYGFTEGQLILVVGFIALMYAAFFGLWAIGDMLLLQEALNNVRDELRITNSRLDELIRLAKNPETKT